MSTVTNRSEILFIYHVKDANPNGDPLDENKPRTDPDTGVATVTDVRIKRTIRDYWHQNLGEEILVRDTFSVDPKISTVAPLASSLKGNWTCASTREIAPLVTDTTSL